MADPGDKKRRATYQDVLDAPEHKVAEIIDGDLHLSPRPGGPHTRTASLLGQVLGPPFDEGSGGPGGWMILSEPELHLGEDIVVPDLAGWRVERMPEVTTGAFFTIVPDWICEVISASTARMDRIEKLALYGAAGVQYAWLVYPIWRSLEVLRIHEGMWKYLATHVGEKTVRAEPFDAIELDLARLWRGVPMPPPRGSRASEGGTGYWDPEYY